MLSSYYQTAELTPVSSHRGGESSRREEASKQPATTNKLVFMPTLAERLSLDAALGYNTEAKHF